MERQGFVEVETPLLMPSTPEGAREFLVPSRQVPGSFYALPQSPQLFKQLLMVGGVDRYYQIARLARGRGPARRPPVRVHAARRRGDASSPRTRCSSSSARRCSTPPRRWWGSGPAPIGRMTWHEAMDRFGVDKPDLRFGMELVELTDGVRGHRVQGVRVGRRHQGPPGRRRRRRLRPQQARRPHRPGQGARRQGPRVDEGRRRRRARQPGRQVPVGRRSRRRCPPRSAPSPATCCCSSPTSG